MEDMCHREKCLGHVGKLEQRFPKAAVIGSVAGSIAGAVGLGTLATLPGAESALSAMPLVLAPGGICAAHRLLNKETSVSLALE